MDISRDSVSARRTGEAGYSWLYRATAINGGWRITITILVIALAGGVFAWFSRFQDDASPDSLLGYVYATIGTILLLLAATRFSLRRRTHHKRELGGLRSALGWHMCFGLMGLAFLGMHSFGELNPRSGTYALYGMVAMVISGLIGRMLDRMIPRMIASEVHQALTGRGEDRIEAISQKLQAIVGHNTRNLQGFPTAAVEKEPVPGKSLVSLSQQNQVAQWRQQTLHTPWDLAYISLESTPQELSREPGQYRFVPDRKSALLSPGALMPGSQEQMEELEDVRKAMGRELFYRHITRYWRRFHILLALTTVGLLIWHLVYAAQLLIPLIGH
ncbi:MAG TPA: hypothetical protein VFN35_34290 [Ktedonobacteraceae bacterium]|nr:hypothetical protein [Ktedonobacteraceae bacterium]